MGPLEWCIGRVVVGVEGSLWFGGLVFWEIFGVSVGVAVFFFRYVINIYRGVSAKFKFRVGLAVGVR